MKEWEQFFLQVMPLDGIHCSLLIYNAQREPCIHELWTQFMHLFFKGGHKNGLVQGGRGAWYLFRRHMGGNFWRSIPLCPSMHREICVTCLQPTSFSRHWVLLRLMKNKEDDELISRYFIFAVFMKLKLCLYNF